MAKAKSNKKLIEELKQLLFAGEGNIETEGLLTFAKRNLPGDSHQRRIARVFEIVEEL